MHSDFRTFSRNMLSPPISNNKVNLNKDTTFLDKSLCFSKQVNISNLNLRNIWLSGRSMDLFVSNLENKSRLTQLIAPYIASDKLLVLFNL